MKNHLTPHLELMVEKEASDLFLTANSPVKIKIEGKIVSKPYIEMTLNLMQCN